MIGPMRRRIWPSFRVPPFGGPAGERRSSRPLPCRREAGRGCAGPDGWNGSAVSSGEDPLLCLWVEAIEGEVGVADQSREHPDRASTAGITGRDQRTCSPLSRTWPAPLPTRSNKEEGGSGTAPFTSGPPGYGSGPVYRNMNRPQSRSLARTMRSPLWSSARATPQELLPAGSMSCPTSMGLAGSVMSTTRNPPACQEKYASLSSSSGAGRPRGGRLAAPRPRAPSGR